jgi:hypothetical protein
MKATSSTAVEVHAKYLYLLVLKIGAVWVVLIDKFASLDQSLTIFSTCRKFIWVTSEPISTNLSHFRQ